MFPNRYDLAGLSCPNMFFITAPPAMGAFSVALTLALCLQIEPLNIVDVTFGYIYGESSRVPTHLELNGCFCPELVNQAVEHYLANRPNRDKGFVINDYPYTPEQVQSLPIGSTVVDIVGTGGSSLRLMQEANLNGFDLTGKYCAYRDVIGRFRQSIEEMSSVRNIDYMRVPGYYSQSRTIRSVFRRLGPRYLPNSRRY